MFGFIDFFNAPNILYFLQKYATRRSKVNFKNIDETWVLHKKYVSTLTEPRLFEFGAGKNLAQNLYLSTECNEQIVIDLNPMADLGQINESALQISEIDSDFIYAPIHSFGDLKKNYRIKYIAPLDASSTGFEDNYIDCCVSTHTLEHIPKVGIIKIFNELKRVIKSDGIVCAKIDYSDHYSHADPSIGSLNFLAFSEQEWEKYNHLSHYQNRLRHYDFVRMFEQLGFDIEVNEPYFDERVKPSYISDCFEKNNPTLYAISAYFVLRVS